MVVEIPVWLLWVLGIVGGLVGILIIVVTVCLAIFGALMFWSFKDGIYK